MSHDTTIKGVKIRDIDAVRKAVAALNARGKRITLQEAAPGKLLTARMWTYDRPDRCQGEYVLKLEDSPYDVALRRQDDGTFAPVLDVWGGHVKKVLGVEGGPGYHTSQDKWAEEGRYAVGQFMQEYTKQAAINAVQAQGYLIDQVTVDPQGNVHIEVGGI